MISIHGGDGEGEVVDVVVLKRSWEMRAGKEREKKWRLRSGEWEARWYSTAARAAAIEEGVVEERIVAARAADLAWESREYVRGAGGGMVLVGELGL